LIVAGKGGVGRTTVAATLARAAVKVGKRVLLAQTDAAGGLGYLLGGGPIGPDIVAVSPGLWAVNMTPRSALREYALQVLHYEALYRLLFDNQAMRAFLGAFPGLDAWALLGKAWWHTTEREDGRRKFDLVILDGPASGHLATMLRIPQAVLGAMPHGPLARPATEAQALLTDPARTAVVLVTLPEDLPAREATILAHSLRTILRIPLGPLVVNGMPPAQASSPDVRQVLDAALSASGPRDAVRTALAGVATLAARRQEAERILIALRQDPALPLVELPRLPTNHLGAEHIEQLSYALDL
jgi:anion-transporting  ArsA/GET3 family ATPase